MYVTSMQLCVGYYRKKLPITLSLRRDEYGDPLTFRHLSTEMERLTGIPAANQTFVVDGTFPNINIVM